MQTHNQIPLLLKEMAVVLHIQSLVPLKSNICRSIHNFGVAKGKLSQQLANTFIIMHKEKILLRKRQCAKLQN